MKGINLRSLTEELHHVGSQYTAQPVQAIEEVDLKLKSCRAYIDTYFDAFSFEKDYRRLPLEALRGFSFDDICKMSYSTSITMERNVARLFDRQPNYETVRKIRNSMWRWGGGRESWNEVVDVWNGIKRFSLGLSLDFEIRLDHTTGYNEFGYSKYNRTYIDGVFAFLVYYKRAHVMTIGFSVSEGRQILIQQVQLKKRSGNRWLYKFPKNRLEFIIDLFATHFPTFTLCVIEGESLVEKTIADYKNGLERAQDRLIRNKLHLHEYCGADIQRDENEIKEFQTRIAQLESDSHRLAAFYKDCGRHVVGKPVVINLIQHRRLELR